MTKEKDKQKREDICKLLENSKIPKETKDRIKTFIERLYNGDLENMFNQLKGIMQDAEKDN